jgi:hypothetical protein
LERLGFPWILSSESSIFNGLRWIFAERNFSRPSAAAPEPRERLPAILACAKAWISHGATVTQFLLFCNKLLALIALAVAGCRIVHLWGFFVTAGLDPAIHENTE